jgi:hypothetical protein
MRNASGAEMRAPDDRSRAGRRRGVPAPCRGRDGRPAQVACALRARDDDTEPAVRHQAAVVEVERLHDPARRVVVLERERLFAELRLRVQVGPLPLRDGDGAEVVLRRPVAVHVALRDEGVHRVDAEEAVGRPSRGRSRRRCRSTRARRSDAAASAWRRRTRTRRSARARATARPRAGSSRRPSRRRGSCWRGAEVRSPIASLELERPHPEVLPREPGVQEASRSLRSSPRRPAPARWPRRESSGSARRSSLRRDAEPGDAAAPQSGCRGMRR